MVQFYTSLDWTSRAMILSVILSILIFIKMENSKFGSALCVSGLIFFWTWAAHFSDFTFIKFAPDVIAIFVILVYANAMGILFWAAICFGLGLLFPGLSTIATIAACGLIALQVLSWMGILRRA